MQSFRGKPRRCPQGEIVKSHEPIDLHGSVRVVPRSFTDQATEERTGCVFNGHEAASIGGGSQDHGFPRNAS